MEKTLYFISGLPRSGSTLLCNILAQNPRFHVSPTSGLLGLLNIVKNNWTQIEELRASDNDDARQGVLRGIINGFYEHVREPVVFDKSRGWPAQIELLEELLNRKIKIIATVRELREILASFETLHRKNQIRQTIQTAEMQTIQGRCKIWLSGDGVVGSAYSRLIDVVNRGLGDRLLCIPYNELTQYPEEIIRAIYSFLEELPFPHDFNNVEQRTSENDLVYGYKDLHRIRAKVEHKPSNAKAILGGLYDQLDLSAMPQPWLGIQ